MESGTDLRSELEQSRAEAEQLRQERDDARRLLASLEEERRRQEALVDYVRRLAPDQDVDTMLSGILERTISSTGADTGSIMLLNDQKRVVRHVLTRRYLAREEQERAIQAVLECGLAGWVIDHKVPAVVADALTDGRWILLPGDTLVVRSVLAIPMQRDDRIRGLLFLVHHDPGFFHDAHLSFLTSLAEQTAIALENQFLLEQTQHQISKLKLLNEISQKVGQNMGAVLDVDRLLAQAIGLIREALDCYHVSAALIEEGELVFRAGIDCFGQVTPGVRLALQRQGESVGSWVARTGSSLLVPDVLQDERYQPLPELPDTRCELAVPLRLPYSAGEGVASAGMVLGVLDVKSTRVGTLSADDQDLLEAVAAQIAVAIESARLFSRVREERATLEAIVSGTDDAIIVTDIAGRVLFFNRAARSAFTDGEGVQPGIPLSEAVRHRVLLDLWNSAAQSEGPATQIPLPDGRTFNVSMTLIPGVGKVAVMHDVTHFKEMDRIKSEFVSTVSHDLRSPLQVIQTSAELLPRQGELGQDQRKEVEHILAIVRRMSELVQNLLDIGRIEAGIGMETELCAIDEIVASAAGPFRLLAQKKGLGFSIDVPPSLPLVRGNRLRLDQVVSNLVSNAIKFTPEGSVAVRARAEQKQVLIEVMDTGIGIAPEAQEELFAKFYRVKSPQTRGIEGTGLGLAITRSIVESYGGRIELQSFPRLGSTFRVILPAYEDGAGQ
jgi:signal transduction histidine kinase/putative methionine-R-sulfoxide reductase with GAF domain